MLMLLQQSKEPLDKLASAYINPEKEVKTVQMRGDKDTLRTDLMTRLTAAGSAI